MKKLLSLILSLSLLLVFSAPTYAAQDSGEDAQLFFESSTEDLLEYIDSFLDRRTGILIAPEYSKNKTGEIDTIEKNIISERKELFDAEILAVNELRDRRDVLLDNSVRYTSFENEVSLLSAEFDGSTARLLVEEFTKLYYDQITGTEPEFTAWKVERVFSFERAGSEWILISQNLSNKNAPIPSNETAGVSKEAMITALARINNLPREEDAAVRDADEQAAKSTSGTFSRQAAADYAVTWWDSRNPSYRSFDADCTNFISQAMYAGGWTHVSGLYLNASAWWYNSLNQSRSWINVDYWHDFACVHSGRTTKLTNPKSLYVGEVLQVDFTNNSSKDHSMIVTTKSSNDIFLTYHTNDTLDRSYNELAAIYTDALWYPHLVYTSFS